MHGTVIFTETSLPLARDDKLPVVKLWVKNNFFKMLISQTNNKQITNKAYEILYNPLPIKSWIKIIKKIRKNM